MRPDNIKKLTSRTPLFAKVVFLYVLSGLLIWGGGASLSALQPTPEPVLARAQVVVLPSKSKIISQQVIRDYPTGIVIERLGIDLAVLDGVYDKKTGEWSLSDGAAYFATITDLPNNNRGNTFIYGHNRDNALGYMRNIAIGDVVKIKTRNNHEFHYTYTHDEVVNPEKTTILYDDPITPRLTVMTCEGIWSEARRLMYFDLIEVK